MADTNIPESPEDRKARHNAGALAVPGRERRQGSGNMVRRWRNAD